MKLEINLGDLTEDQLAELCLAKLEASGRVIVPPVREEPYTVKEAAAALSVSIDTIYADLAAGRMPMLARMSTKRIPAWAIRVRQAGGDPMEEMKRLKKNGFLTKTTP